MQIFKSVQKFFLKIPQIFFENFKNVCKNKSFAVSLWKLPFEAPLEALFVIFNVFSFVVFFHSC